MERSCSLQPSAVSASSSSSSLQDICRFCLCEALPDSPLISPCLCTGSMRYVHQSCLQQWIKSSDTRFCELCKFHFIMHIKMKPLRKWKKLDMSPVEKRDLRNTIFILIITVTYCGGKLYEMIKGTKQNMHGNFWKSWIEFIIDALISLGMLIFLCLSLMSFMLLFWRWKVFNSIIYVQNAPENIHTRQQQHPDDSATELTTNARARECTKQSSKDENELEGCQSCSNSNTVDDAEDTSHKTSTAEIGSSKSTLTSLSDHRINHTNPPLTQVLVISSTFDPMSSTDERTSLTLGVSNV